MSEKLIQGGEGGVEAIDTSDVAEKNLRRLEREALEQAQETSQEATQVEAKAKAEAEAVSGAEVTVGEREGRHNDSPDYSHKELKAAAYERGLERVQSSLSAPERLLSKIMHRPSVDSISNVAAKTVARPSGFLGGAFLTLVGSLVLTYLTRHYGFSYNYLLFIFLFIGGYLLGVIVEALGKLVRR